MISSPFLDLSLIQSALGGLITANIIRDLRILGSQQRASNGLVVWYCPGIAIIPSSSSADAPLSLKGSRQLTEEFQLVIQVEMLGSYDDAAASQLAAIRGAAFTALENKRPNTDWAPIRYQGGQLLSIENAVYTWVDRYSTSTIFTGA